MGTDKPPNDKESAQADVVDLLETFHRRLDEKRFEDIVDKLYSPDFVNRERDLALLHEHHAFFKRLAASALQHQDDWNWMLLMSVQAMFGRRFPETPEGYFILYPRNITCDRPTMVPPSPPRKRKLKKLTSKLIELEEMTNLSGHVWREVLRLKGKYKEADPALLNQAEAAGLPVAIQSFLTHIAWPDDKVYESKDPDDPYPVSACDVRFEEEIRMNALSDYPCCKGKTLVLLGSDSYFLAGADIMENSEPDPLLYWVDHEWVSDSDQLDEPLRLSWVLSSLKIDA